MDSPFRIKLEGFVGQGLDEHVEEFLCKYRRDGIEQTL